MDNETITGIKIARWIGRVLGCVLIVWGIYTIADVELSSFLSAMITIFKSFIFLGLGSLHLLSWQKITNARLWKKVFLLLIIMTVIFVFVVMTNAIVDNIATARAGEKAAPPMLEGLIIFVALIQIPTILFERNPHLLN